MSENVGARPADMGRFIAYLEARRDEATDPKHVEILDVLVRHVIAEIRDLDIEATMATLVEDCVYHTYGDEQSIEQAATGRVLDRPGVRKAYEEGMANGVFGMDTIEVETERFFINDDGVAMDGWVRARVSGAMLVEAGVPLPDGGTPEDDFISTQRAAIFVSFRDGMQVGEDFYFDHESIIEKLAAEPDPAAA